MITIAIVCLAAVIGLVSIYFLGPNNQVEEACEEIIKDETGQAVNLSTQNPTTPKAS